MFNKSDSDIQLLSYSDDQPVNGKGLLIPAKNPGGNRSQFTPSAISSSTKQTRVRALVSILGVFAFAVLATSGYGMASQSNLASTPAITIVNPYTFSKTELSFGPQQALSSNNFFVETRDSFIEEEETFLEIDMSKHQLRFFKKGVLLQSAEILSVAEKGSWWETPSGLYEVEKKGESVFTNIGQVYLPWMITFQGNFIVHGQPTYPDDVEVDASFTAGGIRLEDEAAEILFKNIRVGTPVIIHKQDKTQTDDFVYQPQVLGLTSKQYFIADIDNETILASSDLENVAPIASLVKLMTAVVAAENIDLDGRIKVTAPSFVTSLIPRLAERSSVSMYSLLQLLLVESSNEAAETIAGEIGREEFIEAMNAKARQLGMMDTIFSDPSGLSADNVSSVGDLYRLTKYISENRSFIFDITNRNELVNAQIGGEFEGLINFNEIEDIDSFIGGKVGETLAAGQTSISLHNLQLQGEQRTVVIIILGSKGRAEDVKALISYVENHFGR